MTDTMCYVPFKELYVKPNGKFRNCCIQNGANGYINVTTKDPNQWFATEWEMQETRNALKSGERHPGCQRCWKQEDEGMQSYRQTWNRAYVESGSDLTPQIEVLDLRLGNQCNLKCRMCNATWSNQISSQVAELRQLGVDNSYTKMYLTGTVKQTDQFLDNLFYFIKNTPTIREIKLAGGEPFAMEEVEELIFKLVESNTTNLELSLLTNATIVKDKIVQALEKFKSTHIQCSVDGVGSMLEYQRHPCKWEVIERNFIKLYNAKLTVTMTPCWSNLNVLSMADYLEWTNKFPRSYVAYNEVNTPSYLDWKIVPLEVRQSVIEKLETVNLHNKVNSNYKKFIDKFKTEYRDLTQKEVTEFSDAVHCWDLLGKVKYHELYAWNTAIIK